MGSRSSTSRHLNTTVRRNDKQYRSLSGMHLPFWSPWGITSHKTLPPPVAKASPSNQRCEGAKMPCPYWNWDCGPCPPSNVLAEQGCLSHSCNLMDMRRGKRWVPPAPPWQTSALLLLRGEGRGLRQSSSWTGWEEQGCRCRAPRSHRYPPHRKEEERIQ